MGSKEEEQTGLPILGGLWGEESGRYFDRSECLAQTVNISSMVCWSRLPVAVRTKPTNCLQEDF